MNAWMSIVNMRLAKPTYLFHQPHEVRVNLLSQVNQGLAGKQYGSRFLQMPAELIDLVISSLDTKDVSSLQRTCRQCAKALVNLLFWVDLSNTEGGRYNSLLWATVMDDPKLAEKALSTKGVSSSAIFCNHNQQASSNRTQKDFMLARTAMLVYPTRRISGRPLHNGPPCSLLPKAYMHNSLSVMKHLLHSGAWMLESYPPELVPERFSDKSSLMHRLQSVNSIQHPVVISHVRSIKAAQLLISARAAEFINHSDDNGLVLLTVIIV